jgi:RHS repeat-associated protein
MTKDETGKLFAYDGWNRLKVVKDSSGNTLKTYKYDAMNRRVAETVVSDTTDLYYSAGWQVLEERLNGAEKYRYVWSPVYVDAMVLRDRLDASERLWVQQDANFNVTAITDNSGNVLERYVYDPYGKVTVLNASWTTLSSSAYGWQYLHQGGRLDATSGLYYFRNRDYSATMGRWMTTDPIRFLGGTANFYTSYGNSPHTMVDPAGTTSQVPNEGDRHLSNEHIADSNPNYGYRYYTTNGDKKWNATEISVIGTAFQKAASMLHVAKFLLDDLVAVQCDPKGTGRFYNGSQARINESFRIARKYFFGGDECVGCECLKNVKKIIDKMYKAVSENLSGLITRYSTQINFIRNDVATENGQPSPNTMASARVNQTGRVIEINIFTSGLYNTSSTRLTLQNSQWQFVAPLRSADSIANLLIHELSHALGGTDAKVEEAYYRGGTGSNAIYDLGSPNSWVSPKTATKCNNASSVEGFIREIWETRN